jgi:hypothetical protein
MDAATPTATAPATPAAHPQDPQSVTVISHSTLFYWWPVWAVGFLMGILTLIDGHFLVVMPKGSEGVPASSDPMVAKGYTVAFPESGEPFQKTKEATIVKANGDKIETKGRDVILLPEGTLSGEKPTKFDRLHMSRSSGYGVIFATVLLLVIFITNVPLRGLWSVVVIVTIVLMSIIFALAGWWDTILYYLSALDIRINAGGYFFISGILFAIWIVTILVFDRQVYMVFTPGQFKVCTEIGGAERVFDATGMKLEKQRSDLFRHWVLGLGSGDLIVRTAGAGIEHLELDNVLFIGQKAAKIEKLLKTKAVEAQ